MVAAAMPYSRRSTPTIVDQPAQHVAYAFENVGSIHVGNAERPLRSSPTGATYTVFFDNDSNRFCYSEAEVMEFFRDENVQVVFAGYWYKNGFIYRWDEKGNTTQPYRNFEKRLARTEQLLSQLVEAANGEKPEPERIEVAVPVTDYRAIVRTMALTAFVVYFMAIGSLWFLLR